MVDFAADDTVAIAKRMREIAEEEALAAMWAGIAATREWFVLTPVDGFETSCLRLASAVKS